MKVELKVPIMGESISEGTVSKILKPTGSFVKTDEEVIEIETAKLNQVLYAPATGEITFIVKEGDTVAIQQVLATIDTDKAAQHTAPPKEVPSKRVEEKAVSKEEAPIRLQKDTWVKELKEEKGSAATEKRIQPKETKAPVSTSRQETRKKISSIRKTISQNLVKAKQETAQLTTFNEADMTAIISLREKYKEVFQKKNNVKLGFMSFFVRACTDSMLHFPQVNAYLDGDEIVERHYVDIGIAVGSERGLVVPILRNCETLSYADIEKHIDDFQERAKKGSLSFDELKGGSFTITNGGVYGSLFSTPLLNPPQCAILGMHKIVKRAVVVNDAVVVRPMMYLALTYDHRIIDGKEAILFLQHIKDALEDPQRMMLGL